MSDLAVYDMDRTVTRRPTYTPFLLHCAARRAPWRLLFLPLVLLSMIAYVTRLIDRARLKEINHHLLLGARMHPNELRPLVRASPTHRSRRTFGPARATQSPGTKPNAAVSCSRLHPTDFTPIRLPSDLDSTT